MAKIEDKVYYSSGQITFFWKYWQSILYLHGSTFFFLGSIIYFPIFYYWIDADEWATILFVLGSSAFLLAQLGEWKYNIKFALQKHEPKNDPEELLILNEKKRYNKYFFIAMTGNTLYLIGCVLCIPEFDQLNLGRVFFITGFGIMVGIQLHKFLKLCSDKNSIKEQILADPARALMEINNAICEFTYFTGSILFIWWEEYLGAIDFWNLGCILYTIGGITSLIYSITYFKKVMELQHDF